MISEAQDFLHETEALYRLVTEHGDGALQQQTRFKDWTVEDIIRHLHVWNTMAHLSLIDESRFNAAFQQLVSGLSGDGGLRVPERQYMGELGGNALLQRWIEYARELAAAFMAADPEQRLPWAGPPMSAQSSIVARLMETWSHAQAVYDVLGVEREEGDHIRGIAELGVRTYRWTFANRQEEAPAPKPYVILRAPSGAQWTWNEPSDSERVEGEAHEFCQVVTQTRNIADTSLQVSGANAQRWMSIAQCFAGPAENPPAPGERAISD